MSPTYILFFMTLLLSLALHSASMVSASLFQGMPRLGVPPDVPGSRVTENQRKLYFEQTLDHFNYRPESYKTFTQKYVIDDANWAPNTNAPIFVYLGAESALGDRPYSGFLVENAPQFDALIVYIEHRFYGESIPYGASDPDTRGYFSSAQALADYAAVIVHVKKSWAAEKSPVIVIGGSYGGMLASWFRLKYPHIAIGAVASSAPILYPANFTLKYGFYEIVSNEFQKTSEHCYKTINASWEIINDTGLDELSETFRTCHNLTRASELKDFLVDLYTRKVLYNTPSTNQLAKLCAAIDGKTNSTILEMIFAGVEADGPDDNCYVNSPSTSATQTPGWRWQVCSDMMFPLHHKSSTTMFEEGGVNSLESYIDDCKYTYEVDPRPHWVSTYYGGQNVQDIKVILKKFGSNIIFSNGLADPWSDGGVLEDISDTIRAIVTVQGSHCLDTRPSLEGDPHWLREQRDTMVAIMEVWILTYYNDLRRESELLADGASRLATS